MKKNAINQAEFKARQKEKNMVRLDEWVTQDQKTNIKAYLRGEAEIKIKDSKNENTDY